MVICTSDLHIQFSSTGTLWNVANVVVLLNDDGPVHKPGGFECGKLFTYKPMRLYMRGALIYEGALIFGNKPICLYARKYGYIIIETYVKNGICNFLPHFCGCCAACMLFV